MQHEDEKADPSVPPPCSACPEAVGPSYPRAPKDPPTLQELCRRMLDTCYAVKARVEALNRRTKE